jgi:hypothetical protein
MLNKTLWCRLIASFSLIAAVLQPARSEPIQSRNIEIKISSNAKSIQPDPASTVLPDKEIVYIVKGAINNKKTQDSANDLIQTLLNDFVKRLHKISLVKDAEALSSLYDPSSTEYLVKKLIPNPKLLEGFFKQSALIQEAKWRFLVESDNLLTVFADVKSHEGVTALMPFFFRQTGGQYVPVYQTAPNLMMINILVADQQKLLSVSQL